MIQELQRRSGLGVKEYAEAVDITPAHMSNILNNAQPGSRKILESALRHADMTLESLCLPEPDPDTQQEKKLLGLFRALSSVRRELALGLVRELFVAEKATKKPRQK
jgi:hypothetical protein